MWSHIFLFGSLPRRRPPEFTAILMFEFWREATATSVPGLLCQSGRRRPENVSILSSLISVRPSETLARDWLNTNERQEMVMSTITLMNTIYNLSEKKITSTGTATCVTYSTDYYHWLALESWFTCLNWEQTLLNRSQQLPPPYYKPLISWSRLDCPIRSITRVFKIPPTDVIQLTLTLTTAQVFETSLNVNSSSIQDYVHPSAFWNEYWVQTFQSFWHFKFGHRNGSFFWGGGGLWLVGGNNVYHPF